MAVDFPGSPTNGQVFSVGGASWRYNGYAWARIPDPGEKGQKGQKGDKGEKGQKGIQGDKGVQGNFGGATFEYKFSTDTADTDPGLGKLKLNNATVSSATVLFIDDTDGGSTNTDIQPFLRTIDDSDSTIKGHFRISNKEDADDFALFNISSIDEPTGYFKVTGSYISGSASSFDNNEEVIITFARTGDQGQKGEQGIQGIQGVQDKIFEGDTEAEVVDTGGNGHFKVTTEGTERFKIDNVGLATFTNDVVISNTLFLNKTTSQICKIDHTDANLDLHSDGFIRFFESDNDKLMFTFDVNTTNDDARLILEDDTDTFFNHPGNNQLGFTVGGTDTIRITPGKIGIGIINPGSPIQIVDSTDASIRIFDNTGVTGDLSSSGWKFRALAGNASINANGLQISHGTNERINITTGGNVGINSTTPTTKLEVVGSIRAFSDPGGFVQLTPSGSIELKRSDGSFIDFATAGTEDHDCRIKQDSNGLIFVTGGSGSATEKFRFGSSGQLGLAGQNYGSAGQVLTSQGASSSPQWVTPTANTNTTYDLITSSSGANVQLLLDASVGDDDPILITAGSNVSFAGISATGFTIDSVNTTYDLSVPGSTTKIRLSGSDSTNDDVEIAAGTGISVTRNNANKLTIENTAPDSNTTYDLITSSSGSNVVLTLDASAGDDDPVTITAGSNITLTENGSGTGFTIESTDTTTNTTYDLVTSTSGSNIKLKLDASTGASDDDEITITAGTNVTLTDNNNGGFTIDATNTNTQLTTEQVQDIVGAMFSGNSETRISASYQDSDGTIDLVVDDMTANTNTTYDLLVPSGSTAIRLDPTDSSGNDDITITGGSNISVTRTSSTELTIASSANIDITQLDLNRIRFGPGNAVNDDANIEWLGGSNNGYLRISTSDDNGAEYIELGDYGNVDVGGSFTRWMKLNRTELYMDRDVRLNAGLEDKDGEKGTSGQVLVSTGSQVNWVNSSTVGENTQLTTEQVQDIVGAMFAGNTETRISASYQDSDGTIDLVVDDMTGDTDTTYTAGGDFGMTLSGTEFRLKDDRRRNSNTVDVRSGNTHDYTFYDASHGIRWYTSGNEEMRLENDGDLHVDRDIIAYSTTVSDIRLKKDLQIIQNPLDIINEINGYTFTYKKDDKKSAGVVAQEVEKVFPQAVSDKNLPFSSKDRENPDNYKIVEYDQIVGLLVQAVKELTNKVKKLEGES